MSTLKQFVSGEGGLPFYTVSLLEDLAEMKGRQELYTKQSPEKLKRLMESAMIESAVASNRIEGVEIDQKRITPLLRKGADAKDRNEEEVRNYQQALKRLHQNEYDSESLQGLSKQLHGLIHEGHWDTGQFKEKDGEIIEKLPGGGERIRFTPVSAKETPSAMKQADQCYNQLKLEEQVPPLVCLAAYNLDFLCIHPFRDGNGRVSRLLLLEGLYRLGFEAGRYISVERLIESSKDRYYETLKKSSAGWHEGAHDPWFYINYILYTFKEAYQEMESRLGEMKAPYGEKTNVILSAIEKMDAEFLRSDVEKICHGVSVDMVRKVLRDLQKTGDLICEGKGPAARWKRI